MLPTTEISPVLRRSLVFLAGICAVLFFFRQPFFSGFERIPGDIWDGRLIFGIVDHWRQFFAGERAWNDLGIFWPLKNTMAYSDTFFLEGVPYSILCSLGADRFVAYVTVFFGQGLVGYFSMYWLLNGFLKVRWGLALLAAGLFINLSGMQMSVEDSHLQLLIIWFAPLFVCLLWKGLDGGRRAILWAAGASALLSMMFFSAFYMTWFLVFFLGMLLAVWLLMQLLLPSVGTAGFRGRFSAVAGWLRAGWGALLTFVLVFAVGMLPFFFLYLPASRIFGSRRFSEVLQALPTPIDFINVGERNYLWGWYEKSAHLDSRLFGCEFHFGMAPVTLLLFVVAFLSLAWAFFRRRDAALPVRVAVAAGLSVFLSWVLLLRFGNDSAWYFVMKGVPGADVLRVPFRMNLVVASAALVVTAVFMNGIRRSNWFVTGSLLALFCLLFAEQNRLPYTEGRMLRSVENARIAAVEEPPEDIRAFFVIPQPGTTESQMVANQVTAMLVAGSRGLHTVNGHTGQFPSSWNLLCPEKDYLRNVDRWVAASGGYRGIYGLDLSSGRWVKDRLPAEVLPWAPGENVALAKWFGSYAWTGWSNPESWGVWSDGRRAEYHFLVPKGTGVTVEMDFIAFTHKESRQKVRVLANGRELGHWDMGSKDRVTDSFRIEQGEIADGRLSIVFEVPDARSPRSCGGSRDSRLLGVGLYNLVLWPAP